MFAAVRRASFIAREDSATAIGAVAPAVKFVHWVGEEMDQGLARYSVEPAIQDIVRDLRTSKRHNVFVFNGLFERLPPPRGTFQLASLAGVRLRASRLRTLGE